MSIWGKIVGGAAGFALGGPLGALLGAVAGHVIDSSKRNINAWKASMDNGASLFPG